MKACQNNYFVRYGSDFNASALKLVDPLTLNLSDETFNNVVANAK
jgi:hypothetical protein